MRKLLGLFATVALALTACSDQPAAVGPSGPDVIADHSDGAAPRSEGTFTSTTWANGHLWQFQRNQPVFNQGNGDFVFLTPSDDLAQRPFYVIGWKAGDDGRQSTLFFGGNGHDHVTTAPRAGKGEFTATAQLSLVLPGDGAESGDIATTPAINFFTGAPIELVYAADVDGDGDLEDFTDVGTVHAAWEQGLVKITATIEETVLTMRDIQG